MTSRTTTDTTTEQRILPADFTQFVEKVAGLLGDGWTVDDARSSGLTVFVIHTDNRSVGIKHLWRGEAVQTWTDGVAPREFSNEKDVEAHADSIKHLSAGVRYNVGVCFRDNPPPVVTAENIHHRLLPALNGERPPLRAFPKKQRAATKGKSGQSEPDAPTKGATPAKTATRPQSPRRGKRTQPDVPQPPAKKAATPPKPRRVTAPSAKTTKARSTKTKPTS